MALQVAPVCVEAAGTGSPSVPHAMPVAVEGRATDRSLGRRLSAPLPKGREPPLAVLEHSGSSRSGLCRWVTRALRGLTNHPPLGASGAGGVGEDRLTQEPSKGGTLEPRSFQKAGKPWAEGGAFLLVPKPNFVDGQAKGQDLFEASKGPSCPRGQNTHVAVYHPSLRHENQLSAQGQAQPDGDS